jgi:ABC-type glycerol-3-phosphate transport system substrate-binding protein
MIDDNGRNSSDSLCQKTVIVLKYSPKVLSWKLHVPVTDASSVMPQLTAHRIGSPSMSLTRRRALALAGGTLATPFLVRPAGAQAKVTLSFLHYQTGAAGQTLRRLLDEFQAANPDVEVRDTFRQSEQITAEIQAAIAARRPVDVAQVIGKNIIFHLNNLPAAQINEDPAANAWLARYLPTFLDLGRVGEKIYAIPHAYGTPQLYINRDLFRQAGLDPAREPRTWDEVIEAAKAIVAKTGRGGVAQLHAANKDYGTMLMVTNAGGTYLARDGMKAMFDSPEGIAAMQLWQDLAVKHKVMPIANDQQWTAAFSAGQLGMYMTSSAALRSFVAAAQGKFDLGVTNYPLFGDRPRRVPNSGAAVMVFAPEGPRRQAAIRLLEFFSRRAVANRWSRDTGYMPLSVDPLADPEMAAYAQEFPYVQPSIRQMAETVDTDRWPAFGAIEAQTEISNMVDALWAGRAPASELVPRTVARVNDILAKANPVR